MKYSVFCKRTISIILCVLMIFSVVPQLTLQVNAGTMSDDFNGYSAGFNPVVSSGAGTVSTPYKLIEGSATWSIDSTNNYIEATSSSTNVLSNDYWGVLSGNIEVSADVYVTAASSYGGIIAGYDPTKSLSYYKMYLKRESSKISLYLERKSGTLTYTKGASYVNVTSKISMDAFSTLKMVITNNGGNAKIDAYLNGELITSATDNNSPLLSGCVGLFNYKGNARYDNLIVYFNTASINAPTGLTAALSGNQADLSWNEVSGASSYNLYRKTSGGSFSLIANGLTTTAYTDSGLLDGVTYTYTIRAVDSAAQETGDSNIASVTLPPVAPTGLSATPGDNSVTLTWEAVTGATSYKIYRSDLTGVVVSGTPYVTVNAPTINYTDNSAANGTTYYYVVTANNSAGDSAASSEVSATPVAPAVVPTAPTGVVASVQEENITITWDTVSNATTYTVKRSTTSGGSYTEIQNGIIGTSYPDLGLALGRYYYVVSAVNSTGESVNSAEVYADIVLPSAPTGLIATTPSSGKVSLTWSYSGAANSYNVYKSSDGGLSYTKVNTSPITSKSYLVTGLTDGTPYNFVVTIVNNVGQSAYSESVSATPISVPATFVNVNPDTFKSEISKIVDGTTLILTDGTYPEFSIADKSDITIKAAEGARPKFVSDKTIYIKRCSNIIIDGLDFSMTVDGGGYWIKLTNCNHIQIKNNHFYSPTVAGTGSTWIFVGGGDGDSISHDNYIGYNIMENKNDIGKFIILDGAGNPKIPTQNDIIEYNQFRNTLGRQPNESEPVRLGVSDLTTFEAHSLVQYNTFYRTDSDPEIISVKSCSNVIRYNKFIECLGTVCIRQSFNTEVYGNYFLGNGRTGEDSKGGFLGTGGVRIYSNGHKVYNNYFEGLTGTKWDAAITMTDGDAVNPETLDKNMTLHYPAKNIIIANNTFVNNKHNFEIGFKNAGGENELSKPVTNITIANNLVVASENEIFNIMDQPDNLTLSGNIMFTLGSAELYTTVENATFWSSLTDSQIKNVDPMLIKVGDYYKLSKNSPAINSAIGDYSSAGTLSFITKDINEKPRLLGLIDVGAEEFVDSSESDTVLPTWTDANPLTVSTSSTTSTSVQISWTSATDDKGISGYKIFKNGSLYATVLSSVISYKITGLEPSTSYSFKIVAVDTSGNLSAESNTVTETTLIKVEPVITSISISGLELMLVSSSPRQTVVTATYSDSTTKNLTNSIIFSSSNIQVATVSATGIVTAVGTGKTIIQAIYNNLTPAIYELKVHNANNNTIIASNDAFVRQNDNSNSIDNVFSNRTMGIEIPDYIWIKKNGDAEYRDGFVQFDISGISGEMAQGKLKLGILVMDGNTTDCEYKIYGLNDDNWTESTITYLNQPVELGTQLAQGKVTNSDVGNYLEFDVSDFIKTQTDGKVSFRIRGTTRSKGFKIVTKENTTNTNAPMLIVSTVQEIPVTGVSLDRTTANLKVNEKLDLHATVIPNDSSIKSITWDVLEGKYNIVTVNQMGHVTAVGEGTATVRATVTSTVYNAVYSADCVINVSGVTAVIPVTGISISPEVKIIKVNETVQLTATVIPANATNKTVLWEVLNSQTNIVTVDQTGLVKGVGVGSAKVRATVAGTVYYADCTINVNKAPIKNNQPSYIPYPNNDLNISTGNVTIEQLNNALQNSVTNSNGIKSVEFEVKEKVGAKVYELVLPSNAISQSVAEHQIEVKTPIGMAVLPGNMLNPQQTVETANISFTMEIVNKSNIIDEKIKEMVGDRPVVDISLKSNNETIKYNNPQIPVIISIPYTPTAEELNNIERIIVYYLGEDGKVVKVPNAKYNANTGMVTFKTTHFSKYAISFDNVTFGDLDSFSWAKNQIEVLAAKGIINGTGNNKFSPEDKITRADFIVLLIRTLGITVDFNDNFSDVKKDAYYYEALGIAKKLGIAQGTGNNIFKPDEEISRQDMMVLCARALKAYNIIKTSGSTSDLAKFTDSSIVSDYAKADIASMVKEGIVSGNGDTLNPLGNATRAETAVIMYRIFNK